MSIKLMSEAWDLRIPATEKMVLLCLCDYANGQGMCWPGAESIAARCSLTERTVRKAIKWLEDNGLITSEPRPGRTAIYHINPGSKFTTEANSPRNITSKPRKQLPDTPEAGSDEPSKNHKEPSYICSPGDERVTPEMVFEAWNDMAFAIGKPRLRDMTPERRQAVKARIAQFSFDDFATVFGNIKSSQFLKDWRGCGFDWVMKKVNFLKILEGNYNG